jgi:hypothetical protein
VTRLVWGKGGRGGEATLVAMSGDLVKLVSTVPWPPGARVEATADDGRALKLKVHGSRRREDGAFDVDARLVDVTREMRALLAAAVGEKPQG